MHRDENLMNEDEIIRLPDGKILVFNANQEGFIQKVIPFYRSPQNAGGGEPAAPGAAGRERGLSLHQATATGSHRDRWSGPVAEPREAGKQMR